MNDTIDSAFEPVDSAAPVAGRENADGTRTYAIVEGETFVNNEHIGKPEVVGHIQLEEPKDVD